MLLKLLSENFLKNITKLTEKYYKTYWLLEDFKYHILHI